MKENLPDKDGFFGEYGGKFVPETLMHALEELEKTYNNFKDKPEFKEQFYKDLSEFVGRPSPLYFAENLTKKLGGAKILFKQEHLNHTGSHKITNSLFQVLLAKRMGKKSLICESGAGQHFSATAAVAAKFGMPLTGVMGDIDIALSLIHI